MDWIAGTGFLKVANTLSQGENSSICHKNQTQTLNKLRMCWDKIDIYSCNTQKDTIDISYLRNQQTFAYWESETPILYFFLCSSTSKNECSVIIYSPFLTFFVLRNKYSWEHWNTVYYYFRTQVHTSSSPSLRSQMTLSEGKQIISIFHTGFHRTNEWNKTDFSVILWDTAHPWLQWNRLVGKES